MPQKTRETLVTGETFHVLNRAIGGEGIFTTNKEINRFVDLFDYYRFPQTISYSTFKKTPIKKKEIYEKKYLKKEPIVSINAYALMPNHFHFLLKQKHDGGILKFTSNIQNGFAKYYNLKNKRNGSLFQKPFKSIRIENNDILLHVSRYIHLSPITSYIVNKDNYEIYPWTSLMEYLNERESDYICTKSILGLIGGREKYKKFVLSQVDYQRELKAIKGYTLE